MQRALLLYVVVAECATVFQLLACKNQSLLVWWNALFVLNLGLHVLNRVTGLNIQCDGLAGECFDKNLHLVSWCVVYLLLSNCEMNGYLEARLCL